MMLPKNAPRSTIRASAKNRPISAAVTGTGTHPYFGTLFRVPETHTFWRNRASSGQSRQNARKSAAEFPSFERIVATDRGRRSPPAQQGAKGSLLLWFVDRGLSPQSRLNRDRIAIPRAKQLSRR
jgi:hypothetical protein